MHEYMRIPFGKRSQKSEGVFLWIYARNCTPYAGYELNNIPNVTLVLSQLRWDGKFGAVGGLVESTDPDLETALVREAYEEIGYVLDPSRIQPLTSFANQITGAHVHSYYLEVSYEELLSIRDNATTGKHFSAECAGVNLMHFAKYLKPGNIEAGFCNLMQQQFVCTGKLELEALQDREQIVVDYTKYTLFLDDVRDVEKYFEKADNVILCRSYDEAVALVQERGLPEFVSFDHDLGDTENEVEKSGYEFAKFLVQYMMENDIKGEFKYQVHSANPIGAENISAYLKNWFKFNG